MIFFDLDGTLLDFKSAEYFGVRTLYLENKQHLQMNEDVFYQLWCNVSSIYYKKYLDGELTFAQQKIERTKGVFAEAGIRLSDHEAEAKFHTYLKGFEHHWKAYDDVIPCLYALKGRRLGIISNGDHAQQVFKLERMGIREHFEIIVTSGDTGVAKPDVRIFEIACEKAGLPPEECCYVGDDLYIDILPCEKFGMTGIWLNRYQRAHDEPNIRMIDSLAILGSYLL